MREAGELLAIVPRSPVQNWGDPSVHAMIIFWLCEFL
jgi:hypothetical protein